MTLQFIRSFSTYFNVPLFGLTFQFFGFSFLGTERVAIFFSQCNLLYIFVYKGPSPTRKTEAAEIATIATGMTTIESNKGLSQHHTQYCYKIHPSID